MSFCFHLLPYIKYLNTSLVSSNSIYIFSKYFLLFLKNAICFCATIFCFFSNEKSKFIIKNTIIKRIISS